MGSISLRPSGRHLSRNNSGLTRNFRAKLQGLAGGGFRKGHVHEATDDFGYKAVQDVVSVHDLHATLLHVPGLDHHVLSHPHEGRQATLTDHEVTGARIVPGLLA